MTITLKNPILKSRKSKRKKGFINVNLENISYADKFWYGQSFTILTILRKTIHKKCILKVLFGTLGWNETAVSR